MKLTFNNFAKAYLLMAMTVLGWVGGGYAYYAGFKLLEFMAVYMIVFAPLLYIGMYVSIKTLLHFKPDAGCRGCRTEGPTDAQDIVRQMEEDFQKLREALKHPVQSFIRVVKLTFTGTIKFLKS